MKDQHGIYYYPIPENKRVKMYIRENDGVIEFRLHNENDPQLWEQHGWISYQAVQQAAKMYEGKGLKDPDKLYDFKVAQRLLEDENK